MNWKSSLINNQKEPKLASSKLPSQNWLPSLDGLRAIAVLLVFLEHITGNVFRDDLVENGAVFAGFLNFGDAGMGRSGVYLFFVLSSFLLTNQLLKPSINFNSGTLWLKYGFKRLIRIYPLYFFVLLVYLIFPSFQYSSRDVLEHLFLQKAGNHFWTIPVEIKYYLILPGTAWLLTRILKRNILAVVILCTGFAITSKLLELTIWEFPRLSVLPHLPIFFIGSLAALIHRSLLDSSQDRSCIAKTIMEGVSLLSLLAIVLSFKTVFTSPIWYFFLGAEMSELPSNHWLYLLHGFLWAIFLVTHLHGRGWITRFFSWKPLRYIGMISFGIYLWHIAVLGYLNAHLAVPSIMKLLAIFAVTIAISTVTYLTIEQPMMKLKLPLIQREFYSTKQ